MPREPVIISWSGGKDSMLALHEIRATGQYDVIAAITTVAEEHQRICMHGVRRALLQQQARALGLELDEILLPTMPTNAAYEAGMADRLNRYKARGVNRVVFGDIFLEDLKKYRDDNLAKLGMSGIYPLWKRDSRSLVREFLRLGYETVLVCVDTRVLSAAFAGRTIDEPFLDDLPKGVDPCGENGEFHTFVYKGPLFRPNLQIQLGEKVLREPFLYCDVLEPTEAPLP